MKKIFAKILIPVMAAVLAMSAMAAAACSGCDHDVSDWTVVKEATCTEEGLKEGICAICLNTVQETIPKDPNNHTYGEGTAGVPYPTATSTGGAMFTCTACGHIEEVVLPALTDSGYTSKVTQRPTAAKDGTSIYTYETECGTVSFKVSISANSIDTVPDAVSLGASTESHNMVRSVTGTRGDKKVESGAITDAIKADLYDVNEAARSFSYELYEEYTHIIANGGAEYWMGYDDGEIYGYWQDEQGNFKQVDNNNYIDGYMYYENYTDTLTNAYGTENFLAMLYNYGKANYNGDFTESVKKTAANTTYSFSFGTYTVYDKGEGGALFSYITVSFTLTTSFTIDTFEYYSVTYANDDSTYDASTGGWTSDAAFTIDENGYATVVNAGGEKYLEVYSVTQTLRMEEEDEEECPYTPATRFYSDFDITYNDDVIDESTQITLPAGTRSEYAFGLTNFEPDGIIGDTIAFYYREYNDDGTYTDTEVNLDTYNSASTAKANKILIYYDDNEYKDGSLNSNYQKFCIKCDFAGEVHIVVKTKKVAKEFVVNFELVPPTEFYSIVYNYSSTAGYVENISSNNTATATVYAGQLLYFTAGLNDSDQGVASDSYTVSVTGTTSSGNSITSSDYDITDPAAEVDVNNDVVSRFIAYKAGTYTLTLTSIVDDSVTCTITVTVQEMPSMSSILSGTYSATFASCNTVTVTFGDITETKVTASSGSITEYYECTVTATIAYGDYTNLPLIITYYYYVSGGTVYMLDVTDMSTITVPDNMLDSIMGNDLEDSDTIPTDAIFRITFNEAYDLVISHSVGTAGASEQVILLKTTT